MSEELSFVISLFLIVLFIALLKNWFISPFICKDTSINQCEEGSETAADESSNVTNGAAVDPPSESPDMGQELAPASSCPISGDTDNGDDDKNKTVKKKKKIRCGVCHKKVGLTEFECRCGGIYCGIHRYSDRHDCTFDYRKLGKEEIRRRNPIVTREKIRKI